MNRKTITALASAAVLIVASTVSAEMGRGGMNGRFGGPDEPGMHMGMMKELNLTPDQMDKLEGLRLDYQKANLAFRPKARDLREKVKEELLKTSPDKGKLDSYAAEIGKMQGEMAKQRHGHLLQIKAVLTPEQFEKLVSHEWRGDGPKGRKAGPGCANGAGDGCKKKR